MKDVVLSACFVDLTSLSADKFSFLYKAEDSNRIICLQSELLGISEHHAALMSIMLWVDYSTASRRL